jgi:hypothetical protein
MKPIMFQDIPIDRRRDVAHTRVVCEVRPTKADPNQTRITIGGNTINYTSDCGTKTGSLEIGGPQVSSQFPPICFRNQKKKGK